MRLTYIANLRLPTEKAYGIQIAKTCEAFASVATTNNQQPTTNNFNFEVELIAPTRKNNIKKDFFEYYEVKRNFKFKIVWAPDFYWPGKLDKIAVNLKNFVSAILLCLYALTQKEAVIYTRDEWPAYFLRFFKKNIIFEAHNFSSNRKLFYRRFRRRGARIVVISGGLKDDFVSFGFPENNLLIAPDGVDLDEFGIDTTKEEARKRFDLPLGKKIAVYTGHLYPWKGVGILLEVAEYLHKSNVNYQILIFGGTKKDISDFELNIHPSIRYLIKTKGMIPHQEVAYILRAADCALLTGKETESISAKYTSPLTMFEYMALGWPI